MKTVLVARASRSSGVGCVPVSGPDDAAHRYDRHSEDREEIYVFDGKVIRMDIAGLGIIMYSPANVPKIPEGADYLTTSYMLPSDVLRHVYAGDLVGFGTGSPGTYILRFHSGYPEARELVSSRFKLRLGILITDGTLVVRDLYDLMEWRSEYKEEHSLSLPSGFYHITMMGDAPDSGIIGDNQRIDIYLSPLGKMPELRFEGVPEFYA